MNNEVYDAGNNEQYGPLQVNITAATVTLAAHGPAVFDTTSNAIAATLGDGDFIGQIKTMVLATRPGTNDVTLTVTNHVTSDPEVFTFDAVDEALALLWTGTEWVTLYATATV